MRLLADENFPSRVVVALRAAGHDVLWIRETQPGVSDEIVLALARSDHRVLLTFDKDFGELCFSRQLPAPDGIILFRRPPTPDAQHLADFVVSSLEARADWAGTFSVISKDQIRWRPLQ
ncbi:MAG TPA: DUF5615 family PIN-like protein [Gemmatimonadaceae bacterium]|jgi:predicted nuclease of predicted toxin-antitoxin system|nr:DUF5615 family PIN-like protein [Gemmatimonadaceae bacterium]